MLKMKKFLASILALAMVLGMTLAVSADQTTIKVNNADDATLTYVQVIQPNTKTATGWEFMNGAKQYYLQAFGVEDDQEAIAMLIKAEKGYTDAEKEKLPVAYQDVKAATATQIDKALSLVSTKLDFDSMSNPQNATAAGVYAIKATEEGYTYKTMAAYVGFGVVAGEYPTLLPAVVEAKKSPIELTKATTDSDKATQVDDIITYEVETNVPYIDVNATNRTFKITDKVKGANYYFEGEGAVKTVMMGEADYASKLSIDATAAEGFDQSFTIDLSDLITEDNANAGNKIIITYTVKVTGDDIHNIAASSVSEEEVDWDEEKLYTGKITLVKYDADDEDVKLAGAGFEVTREGETTPLTFVKDENAQIYTYDKEGQITEIVTDENGEVVIKGLNIGTYVFTEKTAPEGYSVNETPSEATLTVNEEATEIFTATTTMADTKLLALPGTGGIGTTIFTVGGCAVMIAAAFLFFANRRKEESK